MKNLMLGVIAGFTIILAVVLVLAIGGRDIKESENRVSLKSAVTSVEKQVNKDGKYTINDGKEMVADFTEALISKMAVKGTKTETNPSGMSTTTKMPKDPNFKLTVTANVEPDAGLIRINAHETFTQVNGKMGEADAYCVAILDKEREDSVYNVTFNVNGKTIKRTAYTNGQTLNIPKIKVNGVEQEVTFYTNEDGVSGEKAVQGSSVTDDKNYFALVKIQSGTEIETHKQNVNSEKDVRETVVDKEYKNED